VHPSAGDDIGAQAAIRAHLMGGINMEILARLLG
jgi:hypothetical protein